MKKFLCILGPDESYTGGMLNVIHQIMDEKYVFEGLSKIHIGTASRTKKILVFLKGLRSYIQLCRKKQAVIAHIQLSERGSLYRTIILLNISSFYGVKTIIHSHGGLFFEHLQTKNKLSYSIIKHQLRKADKVIVLTQGWKEIWSKLVEKNKICIVPNGTIIPQPFNKNFFHNKNYNILFLGNINQIKGIYDLIDAVECLSASNIPVKLRIAGGDQIEECKKYVSVKNLTEMIDVLGWVGEKDREQLFWISDVLVLPSYFESFGLVAIEALAHKVPVICGDKGFTKEVIIDNGNGLICKTGNVEDIASKIVKLYDINLLRSFSSCGYEYVKENYSIDKMIGRLGSIYRELQGNR